MYICISVYNMSNTCQSGALSKCEGMTRNLIWWDWINKKQHFHIYLLDTNTIQHPGKPLDVQESVLVHVYRTMWFGAWNQLSFIFTKTNSSYTHSMWIRLGINKHWILEGILLLMLFCVQLLGVLKQHNIRRTRATNGDMYLC